MKEQILKLQYLATAAAAALMAAGVASAQTTSGAVSGGSAAATDQGAVAGGLSAGATQAQTPDSDHDRRGKRDRNRERRGAETQPATANSATTHGSGVVYTDRNSTSAAVTSGGAASGAGSQSTNSTVDAYGETTRHGASADIYGNSTAQSGTTPKTEPTPK